MCISEPVLLAMDPRWVLPIFSVALLVGVWLITWVILYRLRLKDQIELEHKEAERLKQIDQLKNDFFANVTHELRTPLTLIQGHLEYLEAQMTDEKQREQVNIAQRSAVQLERLVNQLLDIARIEGKRMSLDLRHGDLVQKVIEVGRPFRSLANKKGIEFRKVMSVPSLYADFDPEKLDIILSNLLSNAFKYTDSGTVTLYVDQTRADGRDHARITVTDTGIGIPAHEVPHVFERYFQGGAVRQRQTAGMGVGLALVKEYVKMLNGDISIRSELDKGTEVTVLLPIVQRIYQQGQMVSLPEWSPEAEPTRQTESADPEQADDNRPVVLVVEDNVEIRDFIRLMLGEQYEVLEAADGQAGLAKALDTVPDAVICDIMMPGIDGLELTRTLKADDRTSHVPIIILTAKMGTESRIEGLTAGADAYITKPFSTQELNITLDNLLDSRKQLRTRYSRSVLPDAVKVDEPSMDDRFLQRVCDCVHRHLADEDFDMETLAREVGLSRAQLHRKLTALTGRSATRFVRAYRMEHAHAMLKANVGNISEVAYRVGYPNAAYFTRCFTEDFGYSPSKLRTEHQHRN